MVGTLLKADRKLHQRASTREWPFPSTFCFAVAEIHDFNGPANALIRCISAKDPTCAYSHGEGWSEAGGEVAPRWACWRLGEARAGEAANLWPGNDRRLRPFGFERGRHHLLWGG